MKEYRSIIIMEPGAIGNDRVAKPLSLKRDNGFRGERAGESSNSR